MWDLRVPQSRPLLWAPLPPGGGPRAQAVPASAGRTAVPTAREEAAHLLAQARGEAESVLAAARAEAVALGARALAEGRARGLEQGRAEARAEAAALFAEAREIRDSALRDREAVLDALVGEVARLAADIARQVLLREVEQSPDDIVRLTKHLLGRIEAPAVLRVHPTLSPVLEAEIGSFGKAVEVRADPSVQPGGVIVESPEGALDGTLEGRMTRVTAALRGGGAGGA